MTIFTKMKKQKYKIIGVMSGTSLDGIDLVFVEFYFDTRWHFNIRHFETVRYSKKWLQVLKKLVDYSDEKLRKIDSDYTAYLAEVICDFKKKYALTDLDAVCSHGHTAQHQPEKKWTYQIGNKPILANLINATLVCDFRVQDVAFGGQGAPLVPVGDELLFSNYDFCLNLGGFANISTQINAQRVAYDICPVNVVLNHYVNPLGLEYDAEGKIASTGVIHQELLNTLNALSYYKKKHPKSLGLEWVKTVIFPIIDCLDIEIEDLLKTYVEHITMQIGSEINKKKKASVLITGGGAYNTYLIKRLEAHSNHPLVIPNQALIEYKEAMIFGLLGVLKLRNEVNCLQSVTGANKNHRTGLVYDSRK